MTLPLLSPAVANTPDTLRFVVLPALLNSWFDPAATVTGPSLADVPLTFTLVNFSSPPTVVSAETCDADAAPTITLPRLTGAALIVRLSTTVADTPTVSSGSADPCPAA